MRLLIITQTVDEDDVVLGFFNNWIREFSKKCDKVIVICLNKGISDLPKNVEVFSLGKERGFSRIQIIRNFLVLIFRLRNQYEKVFVHMNPIYAVLGGIFWKVFSKEIFLWYSHKNVDLKLLIANLFVKKILSSSEEGATIKSKKKIYLGHGINGKCFSKIKPRPIKKNGHLIISSVSRISRVKNLDILVRVADLLKKRGLDFEISVWGDTLTKDDEIFKREIESMIERLSLDGVFYLKGSITHDKVYSVYEKSDITINLSDDGGMDKVVLESLLSLRPTFFKNKAFCEIFGEFSVYFHFKDQEMLVEKIVNLVNSDYEPDVFIRLKDEVEKRFDLSYLISKIINIYEK